MASKEVICVADSDEEPSVEYTPSPEDYVPSSPETEGATVGVIRPTPVPAGFLSPIRRRTSDDSPDHPAPTATAGGAATMDASSSTDPFAGRDRSVKTFVATPGGGRRGFTPGRAPGPSRTREVRRTPDEPAPKRRYVFQLPHLAWMPGQVQHWRMIEEFPSCYALGESSLPDPSRRVPMGISPFTDEPISDTVPLLVARLRRIEADLGELDADVRQLPTTPEMTRLRNQMSALIGRMGDADNAMGSLHAHMTGVSMATTDLLLSHESLQRRVSALEFVSGRLLATLHAMTHAPPFYYMPPGPPPPPPAF
ncbi:hypothetical protein SSX86_011019 [Deinandra increscens subsp. villosa]|uniref:Uncharacterized protein n=1 Tax=Deinandra increscens subsp. villosa TaxID=3103831 RepID=A0AAP0H3R8_9ASTR